MQHTQGMEQPKVIIIVHFNLQHCFILCISEYPNKVQQRKQPSNIDSEGTVSNKQLLQAKETIKQSDTHDVIKPGSTPSPPIKKIKWTPQAYSDSEEDETTPLDSIPTAIDQSLVVKWDPSKATLTDSDEETAVPTGKWKVKQVNAVKDDKTTVPQKWKVKQISDVPAVKNDDETVVPEGKWKVNAIKDDKTTVPQKWKVKQVNNVPADEEDDETVVPEGKWKVKQVNAVEDDKTTVPQKWKVKQISDVPADEQDEETVVPEGKWKVKQVNAVEDDKTTVPQKWKVKQISDVPADEQDEETVVPEGKWKVKQVNAVEDGKTTVPQKWKVKQINNVPEIESNTSEQPLQSASINRRSTFTKVDRKLIRPNGGQLKMKWTPKNDSPSSSEEDVSRRSPSNGSDPNEEPSFTSYPTLPRPEKTSPISNQTIPTQRGVSPVRHMIPQQRGVSPLQYNRKSPIRTPSPSPLPATPTLRPPSPRRTTTTQNTGETPIRRQLPAPGQLRSPRQQITPPTKSPGQSIGYQHGNLPRPGNNKTTSPQGGSPSLSSRRGRGLISPSSGQKIQGLASPSTRQSLPKRGGVNQRVSNIKTPSVKPSPSDEGWLDDCY